MPEYPLNLLVTYHDDGDVTGEDGAPVVFNSSSPNQDAVKDEIAQAKLRATRLFIVFLLLPEKRGAQGVLGQYI